MENKIQTGSAYSFSALLLSLFFTACGCSSSPAHRQDKVSSAFETAGNQTQLLQADEALHQRLQTVHEADAAFAELLARPVPTATLDEKNGRIIEAEIALQKTIDSLEAVYGNKGTESRFTHLVGYFKDIVQNRRAVSDVRMALSADSDDSTAAHRTLLSLRNELQEKDKRIAALERATKATNNTYAVPEALAQDTQKNTYAPAKGESPADLRQRNKNLSLAYNNLQTKYFILGRDYLVLKQQHERTLNELAALRK